MANIGIIGAGSWGTALGILLVNNGHNTTLWSHRLEQAEELVRTREHREKLPGVQLPESLEITNDLEKTLVGKDILIMAVPSVAVRQTAKRIKPYIRYGQLIVNVSKGIEEGTLMTLTDIIEEEIPESVACVLSGPSHAEEVSRGLPTTCVAGAKERKTAEYIQNIFMSPVFRAYISPDVLGIELGGALKNVIALAAGAADGLGYGDNFMAVLMTNAYHEIVKFLNATHPDKDRNLSSSVYLGDLLVTAYSKFSRNRTFGGMIGKGYSVISAQIEMNMVAEGYYASRCIHEINKNFMIDMPIADAVYMILYMQKYPAYVMKQLEDKLY